MLLKRICNDTTEAALTFCFPGLNFAQRMSPNLEFPRVIYLDFRILKRNNSFFHVFFNFFFYEGGGGGGLYFQSFCSQFDSFLERG